MGSLPGPLRHHPAHPGQGGELPLSGVDSRRRLRRRHEGLEALDVAPGGRGRCPARGRAREPPDRGRRLRRGSALDLVRGALLPGIALQQRPRSLPAARLRPGHGRDRAPLRSVGKRDAAGPLPRRALAGVRLPPHRGHGTADPRAVHRRGTLARLPRATGRPGVRLEPGSLPGDGLHAGLPRGGGLLRRRPVANPRGRGRPHRNPVPGGRGAPPGSDRGLRLSHRGFPDLRGQADPGRRAVSRRGAPRLHGPERPVRDGPAGRASHPPRGGSGRGPATSDVVSRRRVGRLLGVDG